MHVFKSIFEQYQETPSIPITKDCRKKCLTQDSTPPICMEYLTLGLEGGMACKFSILNSR